MENNTLNEIVSNHNIQRNAFLLTINNPVEKGFDHRQIKETLINKFSSICYFCLADEIGKEGTYHTHIFTCFTSRVRFSTVKKHFPEAHIDSVNGTVKNNIDYIKKSGKWAETEKSETRVEGTFEEWGTPPRQKGKISEMQELYELISQGHSNAEILAINNDYIKCIDKLDKVRTMLLTEKFKGKRRTDLKVVYISGATGTGKTRGVLDTHGDSEVYRVADYKHPFDGYSCQSVICFDEFRSNVPLGDMLQWIDIYPIELPARYANKFACYTTVYIVSNWALEDQYENEQQIHPDSYKAFLRRIHEVRIHSEDGNIKIYNSVDEYLHRDWTFKSLSDEENKKNPFNKE